MPIPIYTPKKDGPMNVAVFASGGGGNLKAVIDLSLAHPRLVRVGLVVTDRIGIPAIDIAQSYSIPVFAYEFEKICGVWSECKKKKETAEQYTACARQFHDSVYERIRAHEQQTHMPIDLIVLSYHRWVFGKLLSSFKNKIINQHAADLTVFEQESYGKRKYIGINPVLYALEAGETKTRTSTFLVQGGYDNGEILSQGPWTVFKGGHVNKQTAYEHELIQKKQSDWPSLTFAVREIARGNYAYDPDDLYPDGCQAIYYKHSKLPYGGVDLSL